MSSDTRPVWLTVEQRDYIVRWHMSEQPLRDIARAWDAAPADATKAGARALADDMAVRSEHRARAFAVLRALGMPA